MKPQPRRPLRRPRRRRNAGILLAIVLLLLGVVIATGAVAIWGLRGDTGAAGRDRESRQLMDCAEQGLAFGKQYFSTTGRTGWNTYFSTKVCSVFGCTNNGAGPFPSTAPNAIVSTGYPVGSPFRYTLPLGQTTATVTVGIYNNPDDSGGLFSDTDQSAVVVARCSNDTTNQVRQVQALITMPTLVTDDYLGQAGRGMRNQGNANNQ